VAAAAPALEGARDSELPHPSLGPLPCTRTHHSSWCFAGCALGIRDSITAITFVALGTSLPDTFASKAATLGDQSADAAIGNVTGSNAVNVFLGLGLPWLIAAIYWDAEGPTPMWVGTIGLKSQDVLAANPGGGFVVPAGDLGFSVTVFCSCAIMCLSTLVFRRRVFGAELGAREPGAIHHKVCGAFFLCLWFLYILMSVANVYTWVDTGVLLAILGGACSVFVIVMIGAYIALNGEYDTSEARVLSWQVSDVVKPDYSVHNPVATQMGIDDC
jgi:hypothetical protein